MPESKDKLLESIEALHQFILLAAVLAMTDVTVCAFAVVLHSTRTFPEEYMLGTFALPAILIIVSALTLFRKFREMPKP